MSPSRRAGSARRAIASIARLALLATVAHGCAPAIVPPSPPRPAPAPATVPAPGTPRPRPAPGYGGRVDDFATVDTTALRGRRIVLDPGHGGEFPGAQGQHGLTEARVNLGVALMLRDLLAARGATVIMTRTDDRDFLTPADSSLRADLAARVRIANTAAPDLFVSIHHNADARGAHDVNETQTYYKLGDDGPSLDAAQSVHRYLVRNLGIQEHRILPGNYYVVRNSDAPAILTESSYLTNPDVESQLALPDKQRLEAEALYLGLAHYFSRPRPVVQPLVARTAAGAAAETLFTRGGPSRLDARVSGPCDLASLSLDGAALDVSRVPGLLWANVPPLASGVHEAVLRVRLSAAGAARERRLTFRVARPAATVRASATLPAPAAGGVAAVRLDVLDTAGFPVADSAVVRVTTDARGVRPADTLLVARDGVAWGYFRVPPGTSDAEWRAALGADAPAVDAAAHGRLSGGAADVASAFARVMPANAPLAGAPGTREPRTPGAWINRDGFAVTTRGADGVPAIPRLAGYRAWASKAPWPPRFVAVAGGALHGRRIVIDPDGGGDDDGGTGPSGARAANLNLEVARALAGLLSAAGADVRLTRDGDFAVSEVERVQVSEAFRADRFVRIGHRADRPVIGYWFASAAGRRWGTRTADRLEALGLGRPTIAEEAQYPLQQVSCPALYVSAARVDDAASEERLLGPGALRTEAYAMYLALAGEWTDATFPLATIRVRDAAGRPAAGALVTLGGATLVETGADGTVRIARTERGPLELEATRGALKARRVLLDSESKATLTGTGH